VPSSPVVTGAGAEGDCPLGVLGVVDLIAAAGIIAFALKPASGLAGPSGRGSAPTASSDTRPVRVMLTLTPDGSLPPTVPFS
jgi:hypothetical protein